MEGRVIYTDAYASDAYDGQMVVTVAVSAAGSNNAIALDVPLDHFHVFLPHMKKNNRHPRKEARCPPGGPGEAGAPVGSRRKGGEYS